MPKTPLIAFERPSLAREADFAEMLAEWRDDAYDPFGGFLKSAWTDFPRYLAAIEDLRDGKGPLPNLVPMDTFWITEHGLLLGHIAIRYATTPEPEDIRGHIGYAIRPSARGRGVATAALRNGLALLRERGIRTARIACDASNAASARVIEKCAGHRISSPHSKTHWVYAIDLP
ncbi:MAG: GNAT family N-acetyltransferase [Vulcanimicrobiaceae bacterium]